jgi:hypothetical protein
MEMVMAINKKIDQQQVLVQLVLVDQQQVQAGTLQAESMSCQHWNTIIAPTMWVFLFQIPDDGHSTVHVTKAF